MLSNSEVKIVSDSASFDNDLTVHPWNNFLIHLRNEIDDPTFQTLFFLLKDKLGEKYNEISAKADHLKFFSELEEKFGSKEKVVTVIENALETADIHDSMGSSLGARVRKYKEELQKYQNEKGIFMEPGFCGRKSLLPKIHDSLHNYKGLIFCGLSGMGKSSLAKKVCLTLPAQQLQEKSHYRWKITYINQRGKTDMKDLLLDILSELSKAAKENMVSMESCDVSELRSRLLHLLFCQDILQNHVIFIDNLDGHCDTGDKKDKLIQLLSMMLDIIEVTGSGPVTRLLLTVGPMMSSLGDHKTIDESPRFNNQMMEYNLRPLNNVEATDMLRQITDSTAQSLQDNECRQLNEFCQGYPMALKTVGLMMENGLSAAEVLIQSTFHSSPLLSGPVEACLQKSVDQLTKDKCTAPLKHVLIQLSVFQSALFDLNAAVAVTCGSNDAIGHGHTSPERQRMKFQLKRLKEHHLLEEEHGDIVYGSKMDKYQLYSLHPIVYQYVKSLTEQEKDLQEIYQDARYKFVQYFYALICEYRKLSDRSPSKAQMKLENNRVHMKRFFTLMLEEKFEDKFSFYKLQKNYEERKSKSSAPSMIIAYIGIWKVAHLVIPPKERIKFCQEQVKDLRFERMLFEYLYWKCLECEDYIVLDRIEMAENSLEEVTTELTSGSTSMQVDDPTGNLPMDWIYNEQEQVAALAKYYEVKARICRNKTKLEEALKLLSTAEKLYQGKEVPDLIKVKHGNQRLFDKSQFKREHATVLNLFGCIYFQQKEYEKSLNYHERAFKSLPLLDECYWHEDKTEYLHNIGSVYHKLALSTKDDTKKTENFKQALKKYSECIKLNKKANRDISTSQALTRLTRADIHYQQQEMSKALTDAESSLGIYRKLVEPPHVNLTRAHAKVALIHWKIGCQKRHDHEIEGAKAHFDKCLECFDDLLKRNIIKGGLPLAGSPEDPNNALYRDVKKTHLKVMEACHCETSKMNKIKLLYKRFDEGDFDKKIQQRRGNISDFHQELEQLKAQGGMFQLKPCSDDSDSDESDGSSNSTSSRSFSSFDAGEDDNGEAMEKGEDDNIQNLNEKMEVNVGNLTRTQAVALLEDTDAPKSFDECSEAAEYTSVQTDDKGEGCLGETTTEGRSRDDSENEVQMKRKMFMRQNNIEVKGQQIAESTSQCFSQCLSAPQETPPPSANTTGALHAIGEESSFTSSTVEYRSTSDVSMEASTSDNRNRLSSGYWSSESLERSGSFQNRRRSWQESCSGNGRNSMGSTEKREQWQRRGSQNSFTSKFDQLLNLTPDLFEDKDSSVSKEKKMKQC